MNFIELRQVSKVISREGSTIEFIKDVDLKINNGDLVFIKGDEINTKTLKKVMTAIETHTTGEVIIFNRNTKTMSSWEKDLLSEGDIEIIEENPSLFYDLTLYENLLFSCKGEINRNCVVKRKVIDDILLKLNLEDNKSHIAYLLSKKHQKKLLLGKALMKNFSLLIVEDFLQELSLEDKEEIMEILKTMASEGKGIIYFQSKEDNNLELSHFNKKYRFNNQGELSIIE